MENNANLHNHQLINYLEKFLFCNRCFRKYLYWLGKRSSIPQAENDLILALRHEDFEKLNMLETLLLKSQRILGLSDKKFLKAFGFNDDLLTLDQNTVHDILAKPILVVNLDDHGFHDIQKLPKSIDANGAKISSADFTAERLGKKYAIELKTVRLENKPKSVSTQLPGKSFMPCWWDRMLKNSLITRIEDKNQDVIKQLTDTKHHFSCDYTMLAFYTRRIGPAKLMETDSYLKEIADIKNRYKKIDYFFFKDYFGEVKVIPD